MVSRGEMKGSLSSSWRHLCVFEGVYASETRPGSTQNGHSASPPFSLVEDLWENSM